MELSDSFSKSQDAAQFFLRVFKNLNFLKYFFEKFIVREFRDWS